MELVIGEFLDSRNVQRLYKAHLTVILNHIRIPVPLVLERRVQVIWIQTSARVTLQFYQLSTRILFMLFSLLTLKSTTTLCMIYWMSLRLICTRRLFFSRKCSVRTVITICMSTGLHKLRLSRLKKLWRPFNVGRSDEEWLILPSTRSPVGVIPFSISDLCR